MLSPTFLNALVVTFFATSVLTLKLPAPTANIQAQLVRRDDSTLSAAPATSTNIYSIETQYVTIQGETNSYVTIPAKTIELTIPTCIQTITPDANGHVPPGTCGAIWNYYPSFGAAILFAVLFGVLTMVHIWQAARYRKGFCWVIIMASIWETCAFTFRTVSTRYQQSEGIYLVYQIFILLSPLWINAFDYMVLGRMIYYFVPSRSLFSIPAPIIAVAFVGLDIISFIIQLVGGSLAGPGSPAEDQLRAIHIYMGGIGLQEFFIVTFVLLAIRFHWEMNALLKTAHAAIGPRSAWKPLLLALYITLGLITTRIVFRFIEFSRGQDVTNPILTHEAYFYVLEAVPMFLALLSFAIVHPGSVLVGPEAQMPGFFATVKALVKRDQSSHNWKEISDREETEMVSRP